MKKYLLPTLLFACFILSDKAQAQVKVNVNVNIDAQPGWGPTGYDEVDYYYLPDIESYYYVPRHQFVYLNAGKWVFAASLPERCRSYDLYRSYKVVINEPRPYLHHDVYRTRYVRYCGYYDHQPALHDHRNKHNHDEDYDGPGNGHGHAYGHYKGHKEKEGKGD